MTRAQAIKRLKEADAKITKVYIAYGTTFAFKDLKEVDMLSRSLMNAIRKLKRTK